MECFLSFYRIETKSCPIRDILLRRMIEIIDSKYKIVDNLIGLSCIVATV